MTTQDQKSIESHPRAGKKKIINIWWDPETEEVVLLIKD